MIYGTSVVGPMCPTGPIRLWDSMVDWGRLQPFRNVWEWDRLDDLVAQANGRQIMLTLGHPAEWAAKGGSDGQQAPWLKAGGNRPPINDNVWSNYVVAVAQRYKGRIGYYQIWNEPADRRFYSGDYDELAFLVKRAKSLIARTDPHAKVVSPPLQPRRQAGWTTRGIKIYRSLKAMDFPFDIWSAHIYPQIGEGTPAWRRDALKVINRVGTSKPLWITETNYNLCGPNNPMPDIGQKLLLDSTKKICYDLNIPRVYWYGYGHSQPELFAVVQNPNPA